MWAIRPQQEVKIKATRSCGSHLIFSSLPLFSFFCWEKLFYQSTWVTQLVEHPTFDFGSGYDLRVVRSSPWSDSVLSRESAWDSLLLPLPLLAHIHLLSRCLESISEPFFVFILLFFKRFYLFIHERHREAETQAEGEAGPMQGARCGTWSWDSRITPWAKGRHQTTQPPRVPIFCFLKRKIVLPSLFFNLQDKTCPLSFYIIST